MLVFNVAASPSASGVNGLDLLRKAPGVRVDMDNNILLLGKAGVQIHINGRPTRLSGNDLATLLENMTSDNIEAIEIDGVRSFDTQRFGASATWKFGNQKVKAAKRSRGAMEEELRRLNGGE